MVFAAETCFLGHLLGYVVQDRRWIQVDDQQLALFVTAFGLMEGRPLKQKFDEMYFSALIASYKV